MHAVFFVFIKYNDISDALKKNDSGNFNITLQEFSHPLQSELSKFINAYKSASSRLIKKEYPEVRQKLWKEMFWSQSFCLLSAGGAPVEVIRQYIETQGEGKSEHRVPFSDLSE